MYAAALFARRGSTVGLVPSDRPDHSTAAKLLPRSTRRQVAPVRVVIRRLRGYLWTMKWVSNSIIALGAVSLLAAGLYLTLEDRTGSAATALSFGFLLVVMLLLAKFRRFKGFGFEAEMWEEKQAEAENLIERLKALSKSMVQQMAATLRTSVL